MITLREITQEDVEYSFHFGMVVLVACELRKAAIVGFSEEITLSESWLEDNLVMQPVFAAARAEAFEDMLARLEHYRQVIERYAEK